MTKAFTKKFIDNSTKDGFQFVFFCDLCGKPYETVFIQSSGSRKPWYKRFGKKYAEVMKSEYQQALFFANEEAKNHFNRCAFCGMVVCDEDFNAETGMCACCSPLGLDTQAGSKAGLNK
jgi:hypothetical protein